MLLQNQLLTGSDGVENKVGNLQNSLRTSLSDSENSLRVVFIVECRSSSRKNGPSLSNHLSSGWNSDSVGDNVSSSIEEDNLASGILKGQKSGQDRISKKP